MATKHTKTITTGVMECTKVNGSYDQIVWKIQNWAKIQLDNQQVENQQFEFEAGENSQCPSKWLIGLKFDNSLIGVNFKLLESKSTQLKIILKAIVDLKKSDGTVSHTQKAEQSLNINQQVLTPGLLSFNVPEQNWSSWLDTDRALTLEIKLETSMEIETGILSAQTASKKSMECFQKAFTSNALKSYGELLTESSSSDTKILSSDGKEFAAHSVVLKAQCPLFQAMLSPENQFSERETGKIEVKDVSGKTMEILLRYFYTGELLPAWRDADTIFEFTYAAGKYQMTKVLEMLDEMIGMPEDSDATCSVPFLSLVNKLGLKKAELRLVERITKQTAAAKTGEDLFKILECNK